MVVRKLNYFRVIIFIVIVLSIIIGSILLIKNKKYKDTYEYKLLSTGYKKEEIKIIEDKLKNSQIDSLLKKKYNENTIDFMNEKYFIFSKLDKYLEYKSKNKKTENKEIVKLVNTNTYLDWFDNMFETDTSKGDLMLVNRYFGLSKDYEPDDIVDVPVQYAYTGKKISNSILDDIIDLINAGKDEGYTFVVSDGYRSYETQKSLYDDLAESMGKSDADLIVALPGHSEYQTGLSFDLKPFNKIINDVPNNEEYIWLKENAYKYGFIFRFEKENEYITQFPSSYWRLRYVGQTAAAIIYGENITFEEYYAYFVENN